MCRKHASVYNLFIILSLLKIFRVIFLLPSKFLLYKIMQILQWHKCTLRSLCLKLTQKAEQQQCPPLLTVTRSSDSQYSFIVHNKTGNNIGHLPGGQPSQIYVPNEKNACIWHLDSINFRPRRVSRGKRYIFKDYTLSQINPHPVIHMKTDLNLTEFVNIS